MSAWVTKSGPLGGGIYTAHQEYAKSARIDLEQVSGLNWVSRATLSGYVASSRVVRMNRWQARVLTFVAVYLAAVLHVGAFSLAFEDIKVPVAGIPITITRTYDRTSRANHNTVNASVPTCEDFRLGQLLGYQPFSM